MRDWFESLAQRERIILIAGGVLAVLIIAWTFVWTPLRDGAFELDGSVTQKNRLLANLRRVEAVGAQANGGTTVAPTQSLVLLVDQTHRAHGLAGTLSRNQPDGSDGIRVTFQSASFDELVSWLGALQQSYGVLVESASFDGTAQPGIVSATLVLRRS
jgi:general secretion pathway protein M